MKQTRIVKRVKSRVVDDETAAVAEYQDRRRRARQKLLRARSEAAQIASLEADAALGFPV